MAVYHITLHAYRSWPADHPRGYVHHIGGLRPPDPLIADARDRLANFDEVQFDYSMQALVIRAALESCRLNSWRLHGAGTDPSHIHFAISWKPFLVADDVMNRLKNGLSFMLGRDVGPRGRKWFVRGGDCRRVKDKAHLDHLLNEYLPGHPGVFWREGQPVP